MEALKTFPSSIPRDDKRLHTVDAVTVINYFNDYCEKLAAGSKLMSRTEAEAYLEQIGRKCVKSGWHTGDGCKPLPIDGEVQLYGFTSTAGGGKRSWLINHNWHPPTTQRKQWWFMCVKQASAGAASAPAGPFD